MKIKDLTIDQMNIITDFLEKNGYDIETIKYNNESAVMITHKTGTITGSVSAVLTNYEINHFFTVRNNQLQLIAI